MTKKKEIEEKRGEISKKSKNIVEKLKEEKAELMDKYLRALANYENLRKRTQEEKVKIYNFAIEEVFREILPILDDFSRAFDVLKKDGKKKGSRSFIEGMHLIHLKLKNNLKKYQIEPFHSKGKEFDPSRHEAVHVIESEEEEGKILEEVEQGYKIGDKILRPSKVIVAKEKEDKSEDTKENKNKEEE
mgnify:CR=1 FL=1